MASSGDEATEYLSTTTSFISGSASHSEFVSVANLSLGSDSDSSDDDFISTTKKVRIALFTDPSFSEDETRSTSSSSSGDEEENDDEDDIVSIGNLSASDSSDSSFLDTNSEFPWWYRFQNLTSPSMETPTSCWSYENPYSMDAPTPPNKGWLYAYPESVRWDAALLFVQYYILKDSNLVVLIPPTGPASKRALRELPNLTINDVPSSEANVICCICQWKLNRRRKIKVITHLPCKHYYHLKCLKKWMRKTNTCPHCDHQMPLEDIKSEAKREMINEAKAEQVGALRANRAVNADHMYLY